MLERVVVDDVDLVRAVVANFFCDGSDAGAKDHGMERLTEEILLLKEEMRVKDARMSSILAQRRPHYLPTERLAQVLARAGLHLGSTTVARMLATSDRTRPVTVAAAC